MSKEWDIDNVQHLIELVHNLIISEGGWTTEDDKRRFKNACDVIDSYRQQVKLKEQLKDAIEQTPHQTI
jgi:hypothetical protein